MGSRRQSGGWGERRRAWRRGRRGELQRRRGQRKGGEGWERRGWRQGGVCAELHQGRGRFRPLLSEENNIHVSTVSDKNRSLCHHWPKLAVSYAILNLVIILRIGHNFVT